MGITIIDKPRRTGKTRRVIEMLQQDKDLVCIVPTIDHKKLYPPYLQNCIYSSHDFFHKSKGRSIRKVVLDEAFLYKKDDLAVLYYNLGRMGMEVVAIGTVYESEHSEKLDVEQFKKEYFEKWLKESAFAQFAKTSNPDEEREVPYREGSWSEPLPWQESGEAEEPGFTERAINDVREFTGRDDEDEKLDGAAIGRYDIIFKNGSRIISEGSEVTEEGKHLRATDSEED